MSRVAALIGTAFDRLAARGSYAERPAQRQLALLIADMILGGGRGLFEAPTGLGKSLAALVPAIACAIVEGKRTAVATYTNVLAEQYWANDLPLALSLFDETPTTAFLIGRARYACRLRLEGEAPRLAATFVRGAKLGVESEFRRLFPREPAGTWTLVQAPPACPARACPLFEECYLYSARRQAQSAAIVVTNHSVVLAHARSVAADEERAGPLGRLDHLVLDEAHDFPSAAAGALRTELSRATLETAEVLGDRIARASGSPRIEAASVRLARTLRGAADELAAISEETGRAVLLAAEPADLTEHPAIVDLLDARAAERLRPLTELVAAGCRNYAAGAEREIAEAAAEVPGSGALDATRNLLSFLREAGEMAEGFFPPPGEAPYATHLDIERDGPRLRRDPLDLAPVLRELLWDRIPATGLSATLALDGEFEHFRRVTGFRSDFEEILPSPFDHPHQAAVYLPPPGTIPDPTTMRDAASEPFYWQAVAEELSRLIRLAGGRTLALFHSRREMEGVAARMVLPPDLPLLVQPKGGIAEVGRRFRESVPTSLFALRSFWTGFDARGETLSVVALVRVPFEVPTNPELVARLVHLAQQGFEPFRDHTLANAKMLLRQGAGRLVRSPEDRGLIAMLDPRVRTKRYGEELLANLPAGMRRFDDAADALGWLELGG